MTEGNTLWKARLETRNFTFEAFGVDELHAQAALEKGLEDHARTYKLALDWYQGMDVDYQEVQIGKCYRDREEVK